MREGSYACQLCSVDGRNVLELLTAKAKLWRIEVDRHGACFEYATTIGYKVERSMAVLRAVSI